VPNLKADELAAYLAGLCPWAAVELREEFAGFWLGRLSGEEREAVLARLAVSWAGARLGPAGPREMPPLPMEVSFEKKRLADRTGTALGLLYDGLAVMTALRELITPEERTWQHLHLVFTDQLLATPDAGGRYHCRVALFGYPCLISTSGAVEGPAKPRAYYRAKQQARLSGIPAAELAAYGAIEPQSYLDYGDQRLTEVLKGYVAQAVAYQLAGEPFCDDRACRLFNAHWQEEMLFAQLASPYEFCPAHGELFRRGPSGTGEAATRG
jgi:hypothetical protein